MALGSSVALLVAYGWFLVVVYISDSKVDPLVGKCVERCEKTGVVEGYTIQGCQLSHTDVLVDHPWYPAPLVVWWKQLKCTTDCQYRCMIQREIKRDKLGEAPFTREMWPFKQVFFLQDPLSAVFSACIFFMHVYCWLKFYILVYHMLPLRTTAQRTYYEYTGLCHVFALLTINSWFCSCIFHIRPIFQNLDLDFMEKLDCFSAVAAHMYSFIFCMLRVFRVTNNAERIKLATPVLVILAKHIWDLSSYMDYAMNKLLCLMMGIFQTVAWLIWGMVTHHPARFNLFVAMTGFGITMLLDFPYFLRYSDDHYYLHAFAYSGAVVFTYIWWSFIEVDAVFRTAVLRREGQQINRLHLD